MRVLYLSYERGLELEKDNSLLYVDRNTIKEDGFDVVVHKIKEFSPELVIEREFNDGIAIYTDLISTLKEQLPKQPTYAVWLIDTHVSELRHQEYAKHFDVVFMAVSRFVEPFREILGHNRVYWLPLCYPQHSDSIRNNFLPIKYPISFVGRWNKEWFPERTKYIEKLHKEFGSNFYAVTDYDNMNSIIRMSKVSFNCAIKGDLNFRVFEVLGLGTELVTDDVEDLKKISGLRNCLHVYKNEGELIKIIKHLLANDPKYTHNTTKNQKFIKQRHTIYHRHKAMIDMIQHHQQLEF